ncbi:hypothetical protein K3495_g7812 [Podosphaera aphanis]|nr:hypothetical protein K3495_g7812 [Podosphaera aphanis]
MGHQNYVAHGIGPVGTEPIYIRGDLSAEGKEYLMKWRKFGYMWSDVANSENIVSVFRMCRDTEVLPDGIELFTKYYNEAKLDDVAMKDGIPRWVNIFRYMHGDTNSHDDDLFRQEALTPGCSSWSTDKCTSKDIIKLAHLGQIAVDGEYNCFVEGVQPGNRNIPTYTFDKMLRVEEIVDLSIRTTLTTNPENGSETAIVTVLGRVHLIQRESYDHAWYLVNKAGKSPYKDIILSSWIEEILSNIVIQQVSDLRMFGKTVKYVMYYEVPGTQHLTGYVGCPYHLIPVTGL